MDRIWTSRPHFPRARKFLKLMVRLVKTDAPNKQLNDETNYVLKLVLKVIKLISSAR